MQKVLWRRSVPRLALWQTIKGSRSSKLVQRVQQLDSSRLSLTLPEPAGETAPTVTPNVTWPDSVAQNDRVPTELVLAYAANAGAEPMVRPAAYPVGTQRPNALIATKSPPASHMQRSGQRGDDPWLRGIVMAPSVQYSMRVAVFGGTDPRSIRPYMVKPQQSVHMVFSDDPQFGMVSEYFSGSAVAFLPTVSFARTAGLN